jgi:hypothetical protein
MESAMSRRIEDLTELDVATSVSICKGIGERLRQTVIVDRGAFPPRLQNLIEELHRQETKPDYRSN